MILTLVSMIFTVYAVTLIICTSSILDPPRQWFIDASPGLYSPFARYFPKYIYPDDLKHFIECRMCVGIWVSALVCLWFNDIDSYAIVFGASYFLTTQER